MNYPPAKAGWGWLKQGFVIFRKHPGQLTMLFTSYMFVMIGIGFIPVLGQLLPMFLAPTFSMVFMVACAQYEQQGQLNPLQLRATFVSPVSRRLFILGGIYLLAALLAVAISFLLDGGIFTQLMAGNREIAATPEQRTSVLLTLTVLAAVFIPVFWYVPPLIVWQKMSIGKAIFYSFFSVIRSFKSFLVYGLSWLVVGAILPTLFGGLLALVVGQSFAMLLMLLLTIVLTVVMYCSFYPTYVAIFGPPELPQDPPQLYTNRG